MPNKEKLSELTICLDKTQGGTELFKAELDMTKYGYGKFNIMQLQLQKCESNEFETPVGETYLEIGLRGTKADGLVQKRMSEVQRRLSQKIQNKFVDPSKSVQNLGEQMKTQGQSEKQQQLDNELQKVLQSEIQQLSDQTKKQKLQYEI